MPVKNNDIAARTEEWAAAARSPLSAEHEAAVREFMDPDSVLAQAMASVDVARAETKALQGLLEMDAEWSLPGIVARLADAADHLLEHHDCDAMGYEGVISARDAARAWLAKAGVEPRRVFPIAPHTKRLP